MDARLLRFKTFLIRGSYGFRWETQNRDMMRSEFLCILTRTKEMIRLTLSASLYFQLSPTSRSSASLLFWFFLAISIRFLLICIALVPLGKLNADSYLGCVVYWTFPSMTGRLDKYLYLPLLASTSHPRRSTPARLLTRRGDVSADEVSLPGLAAGLCRPVGSRWVRHYL